jgi:hypothetical protein
VWRAGLTIAFGVVVACNAVGENDNGSGVGSAMVTGSAACPGRLNAALCPAVPELGGQAAWVGCQYSDCSTSNTCTTCNCVALDGGAAWNCDAGSGSSNTSCPTDASIGGPYAALDGGSNDPRCPTAWADLTTAGYPNVCAVQGLICAYPEGQAECWPDGTPLKWWQSGLGPGCPELPPALCQPCTTPGNVCGYITGPAAGLVSEFSTNVCCNGNTNTWEISASGRCPNGNVCGTIQASDYDQKCSADSDCTGVTEGDLCTIECDNCTNATINVNAQMQYQTDFAKKLSEPSVCPCPFGPTPVCKSGVCGLP